MPELYLTPFSVEIHNISAHLDSRNEWAIQYQLLSNTLAETFYVKHKMMASIKKLQDKLNKKETLMTSWYSNWRLHTTCLKMHHVKQTAISQLLYLER